MWKNIYSGLLCFASFSNPIRRNQSSAASQSNKQRSSIQKNHNRINFLNPFKPMNRLITTQWVSPPCCAHKLSPAHARSRLLQSEVYLSSPRGAGHAFIFSSWKIRVILRRRPVCRCRTPARSNRSSELLRRGCFHPGPRLTWFVSLLFQPIKPACMCRVKRDHWR